MRERHVTLTGPVDELHARASAVAASDDRAEKIQKRAVVGCSITGVVAAVVFFGGLVGVTAWPEAMEWTVPAALWIFVAGLVVGIGTYAWYSRYDLDDRKVATLQKLLAILRADVPPAAAVRVDVDFRDYRKGRLVRKDAGFWASRRSYVYAQPWLTLRAPLADGSRLQLAVVDHVKRKEKSKRKYTKVRETARSRIRLALRLGKNHPDAGAVREQLRGAPQPGQTRVLDVQARGRVLLVTFLSRPAGRVVGRGGTGGDTPLAPSDADTLLQALRWVYRGLARQPA